MNIQIDKILNYLTKENLTYEITTNNNFFITNKLI